MKTNENMMILSEVKEGETFKTEIGEIIVLEHTEEGTKVITRDLFRRYVKFGSSCDYKGSSLQKLCEGEIYEKFVKVFGEENIVEHEADLITVDMQQDYGRVKCRVRPITFDEARKYNNVLVNAALENWYWTITPWSTEKRGWKYTVSVVSPSGDVSRINFDNFNGVRPFCILKSNIFVSKGK